ncbi:L-2-hydroxyglutarate oxidase [Endozoicomonas montiporae]|uniref:L-2-hydroxyglutarate oxidase n=1 Tax=Endozoicomonas montiporae CL-33 TaxID=570277 RepID=A0A142BDC0_9GAMM|nr:L-2-hydroxyglutarate oxidase [Endozoicomonas montiporae]AMO56746.1 L-2-hydroxyglutarate oxidase [Endozoicomonas montiporae CL-33]
MMYDFIVLGGGIVGVSTAWQLKQRYPAKSVLLLEKESELAQHQTGHNSGVIHAGVYYAPGSLKARFCKAGVKATMDFCDQQGIPYDQCGKLLVATNELEFHRMEALYARCLENGIEVEWLDAAALKQREPNIVGCGAIYVKTTGIVDYSRVTRAMARCFEELGGEVRLRSRVVSMEERPQGIRLNVDNGSEQQWLQAGYLVCCTGLMADRTTRMLGIKTDFQIIPYRGEYYQLAPQHNNIVNHLIYPIPDPDLPFLGVHLTRMIDGSVTVGPNAVQGWKREGYSRINMSLSDIREMVSFAGFWRATRNNLKTGLSETLDSIWKRGYLRRVQKYCPQLQLDDLTPYPAGIRAQAVMKDGSMVHDFLFAESPRSLHVCNAPSPAATSAIPIGEYICQQVSHRLPEAGSQRTGHLKKQTFPEGVH